MLLTTSTPESGLKRLLTPLVNPAQYDFWASQLGSIDAWQRCYARVHWVRQETPNTRSIGLRVNRNWKGFEAGQHCNVVAEMNGRRIARSYSLSGVAGNSRELQITVRQETGGKMSAYLCKQLSVGDRLELEPAFGSMTLPQMNVKHLLLLAAGSGVTPMLSLVRTLAQQSAESTDPLKLSLLYWERDSASFIAAAELQSIAETNTNIDVQLIPTGASGDGRINANSLLQHPPLASFDRAYACGPAGFVKTAGELCQAQNIPFQFESFTPIAEAPVIDARLEVEVVLRRSQKRLRVNNQQSLLDQLEAQGISLASGCRQGICNTCSCERVAGQTRDQISGELDAEPGQSIRLCVSRATSDIELNC